MSILRAAHVALERGWNVIPVHHAKGPHAVMVQTGHAQPGPFGQPVPQWRVFQQERVTPELVEVWFHPRWKVPGLAAVTGAISNLVVLDFDGVPGRVLCERWQLQPNSLSGSGGPHLYFPHPGWRVSNAASGALKAPPFPGLDVRGDGGMIILPPSVLKNGPYQGVRPELHEIDALPPAAAAWTGLTREAAPELPSWERPDAVEIDVDRALNEALSRAGGGRDNAGYGLARTLQASGMQEQDARWVMRQYAQQVAQHDGRGRADPYTERDALRNLRSAYQRPAGGQTRQPRARSLEERVRAALPSLSLTERQDVARLLAATLLREAHGQPEQMLRGLGLAVNTVEVVRTDLAAGISVRGRAALERLLSSKRV